MFTIRKWTKAVRRENGNWWNLWFDENCANVFCWMQKSTLFHRTFFCLVFVAVVVFASSFARGVLLLCVCVWSLVTKLYTSRNRWKQDKAINFSMPKCCERIVQPVDNMSLSWPTTVTERNGKKILCWFEWTLGYTFTEFTFLWCSLYSVRKHFFSAAAARKVAQNPKLI